MRALLALLFSLCWARSAGAFPDFDASLESPILPASQSIAADTLGNWTQDAAGLSFQSLDLGELAWWLPRAPEALIGDGIVRLRVELGTKPDFSLLLRAGASAAQPQELDAYGVSIEGKASTLSLHRWERGNVYALGAPVPVSKLSGRESVEIVALLQGPWLVVTVFDALSLETLATASVHDDALLSGRVGFRAFPGQDPNTRVTHLSIGRASRGAGDKPEDPLGDELLVRINAEDRARLPKDLAASVLDKGVTTPESWLLTNRLGLERLRRLEIPLLERRDEVPWWALDARYRARMDRPPTPTPTGFRLDESLKDLWISDAILRGYAERYSSLARIEVVGKSGAGREIIALRIAGGKETGDRPAVILMAAHHASELLTLDYALDAVQWLLEGYARNPRARRLVDALEIWVIPVVNPDGNIGFTRQSKLINRKNLRDLDGDGRMAPYEGVDLNRNYPFRWGALDEKGSRTWRFHSKYRGPAPASEPEVQAMMRLADSMRFAAGITWHTNATAVLAPYTIDGARSPEPELAWKVAEPLVQSMPALPGGRRFRLIQKLYPVDGTDQDWFFHTHGTLTYNVEGSHHNPLDARTAQKSVESQRPFWVGLCERLLDGPTVSGHVLDAQGRPVEAQVSFVEFKTFEGESWKSRPRDGRFDRMLPEPGLYTIVVSAPGFAEQRKQIQVQGLTQVELRLRPLGP